MSHFIYNIFKMWYLIVIKTPIYAAPAVKGLKGTNLSRITNCSECCLSLYPHRDYQTIGVTHRRSREMLIHLHVTEWQAAMWHYYKVDTRSGIDTTRIWYRDDQHHHQDTCHPTLILLCTETSITRTPVIKSIPALKKSNISIGCRPIT